MRGLHPKQPQFEKLRRALARQQEQAARRKILANMESGAGCPTISGRRTSWPTCLSSWSISSRTTRASIRSASSSASGQADEHLLAPVKTIVFKPMWRVPESIKVHELQPNLRRGGSMFRQYDLEFETKDGQPLDYHSIDWNIANIRDYEVVQPPGRKNVMASSSSRSQPVHHLHARHHRQVDIRQRRAHVEPRLPAAAQPDEHGRAGAGRGQGLGRCQGPRDDAVGRAATT